MSHSRRRLYIVGFELFFASVAFVMMGSWAQAQSPSAPPAQVPGLTPAQPVAISGQVRRSGTLKPVAKALVIVEGTSLQATSDTDGRFSIPGVPAGPHHIVIAAPGFMPLRVEINASRSTFVRSTSCSNRRCTTPR